MPVDPEPGRDRREGHRGKELGQDLNAQKGDPDQQEDLGHPEDLGQEDQGPEEVGHPEELGHHDPEVCHEGGPNLTAERAPKHMPSNTSHILRW